MFPLNYHHTIGQNDALMVIFDAVIAVFDDRYELSRCKRDRGIFKT